MKNFWKRFGPKIVAAILDLSVSEKSKVLHWMDCQKAIHAAQAKERE